MTPSRSLRICFVASELLGAHKNGGIGTATTHLALFFARQGHFVRIIYTGSGSIDYSHVWILRCAAAGIDIVHLDGRKGEIYPIWTRETCIVFEYLRHLDHDVIVFQDWEGSGFASVIAKRAGIAFARSKIAILAHGPTAWLLDANRMLARHQQTLAQLHMERMAFDQADAVVCPSRHMLEWLRGQGHPCAEKTQAIPLYLWSDLEDAAPQRSAASLDRVETVAYFGRWEKRKGIELFLEAIVSEQLAFAACEIVFVGKPASYSVEEVLRFVELRRPWLVPKISFQTDLDTEAAQNFLIDRQCLAIIPSLIDNAPCVISECLRRGIPFISTDTGGIPELIAPEDRARVLVEPNAKALAGRIDAVLGGPFAAARPAHRQAEVAGQWLDWLDRVVPSPSNEVEEPEPATRTSSDRIAVIVTHYERPALVLQTLESLASQTFIDFELVLVDDGSTSREARDGLDLIERRDWPFRLTLLRQPNRYLGAARNAGLRATTAERVVFMDDDNLAFPDMVEVLNRAMTATDADIVTCQMSIFKSPEDDPVLALLDGGERWAFTCGPLELGLSINCFGDASSIYRRKIFEQIGYFHEWRKIGHEDWHLHARAALAGLKLVPLPVSLFWYRRVSTGMLSTTDNYANNKIIWDLYKSRLPCELRLMVDLSIRNEMIGLS